LYGVQPSLRAEVAGDQLASWKALYEKHGDGRTNLAYGYVRRRA